MPEDERDNAAMLQRPLQMRVLGIVGGDDAAPARAVVAPIAHDARFESIPGAKHLILDEQPRALAAALVRFFSNP